MNAHIIKVCGGEQIRSLSSWYSTLTRHRTAASTPYNVPTTSTIHVKIEAARTSVLESL